MVNFSAIDLSPLLRSLLLPVKYDISSQRKGLGAKHVHLAAVTDHNRSMG